MKKIIVNGNELELGSVDTKKLKLLLASGLCSRDYKAVLNEYMNRI